MEGRHVPRAIWRRRRSTDSPRPAGRQWTGRLRAGGTKARQMLLVPVGRLRRPNHGLVDAPHAIPGLDAAEMREIEAAATSPENNPATPTTIPLLPGERTMSRRI